MSKVIMIGCDLHDVWTVLKVAVGQSEDVLRKAFPTSSAGEMITWMKEFAAENDAPRIVFAYEASGQGFWLHDELTEAGIECHVLAPTHLPHTAHRYKNKNDDRDAQMILDEVRAYVLAGRKLPDVWVPDRATRDDREVVRLRLEFAAQRTRIKNQIRNLLKRWKLKPPQGLMASGDWSRRSIGWLRDVASGLEAALEWGSRAALDRLVDMYEQLCDQLKQLNQAIAELARRPRYDKPARRLMYLDGIGTLTAMTFLTELGDLDRFRNRRQLAAYLGLAPAAFESGERNDRKGHITRQGPARVRHVLCQAAWAAKRGPGRWAQIYDGVRRDSKKRTKIAIVALMRRLAISMWHRARSTEFDALLEEAAHTKKPSARARRKGDAPPTFAVASASSG